MMNIYGTSAPNGFAGTSYVSKTNIDPVKVAAGSKITEFDTTLLLTPDELRRSVAKASSSSSLPIPSKAPQTQKSVNILELLENSVKKNSVASVPIPIAKGKDIEVGGDNSPPTGKSPRFAGISSPSPKNLPLPRFVDEAKIAPETNPVFLEPVKSTIDKSKIERFVSPTKSQSSLAPSNNSNNSRRGKENQSARKSNPKKEQTALLPEAASKLPVAPKPQNSPPTRDVGPAVAATPEIPDSLNGSQNVNLELISNHLKSILNISH